MINVELQRLKTRVGNSFLRAFYPIDYRSTQNIISNLDKLLERETRELRTMSSTTSQISQKIGRTINTLAEEVDKSQRALDDLQNKLSASDEILLERMTQMEQSSLNLNGLLGALAGAGLGSRRGDGKAPKSKSPPKGAPPDKSPKTKSRFKLPGGLGLVGTAITLWSMWDELSSLDPNVKKEEYKQNVAQIIIRTAASVGLMYVGAVVGGIVAGAIAGPGAIVGFIGGLLGGAALDFFYGDSVDDIVNQVVDYLYTGDDEETPQPTEEDVKAVEDATVSMRETTAPPLQPPQNVAPEMSAAAAAAAATGISSETRAQFVGPPIAGPTPPVPPAFQVVDGPVMDPAPIEEIDFEPPINETSRGLDSQKVVDDALRRAKTIVDQNEEEAGGITDPNDTTATIDTSQNLAGGTEEQAIRPSQSVTGGAELVFQLQGKNRSGMPNADVLNLVAAAAASVGMEKIAVTSGKGDYISPAGRAKGQKSTFHSTGKAVDVAGFSSQQQKIAFAQAAISLGAGGIGAYRNGSLHVDTGPRRSWNWGDPNFPKLAEGAKIEPTNGGTLALIGEAGEPEYVVPQSKAIKFAHEMISAQPRYKTKKHTHYVIVPILT